ncbi:hypothetical protein CBQ28_03670 [Pseudoalteromonas sp. GCY]|uniref:prepilin-type N-terminal cleavage/methylation domain-containing protein n=1 Tax=Pseudoalteromonas sp. GCY TaxID=2003316 RepID=UPI000BFEE067|nr:prepilin-type N-terminal cleavage/methylation domain-containing protein [Pseudoalteromonas sp. GCY]PHI38627.1 hypothetical protein CBQ28_03670 [Pseudoalteromonas sp. GCY]QQQ67720.1 prepilin-type N-terminal cleavage/methylation domain-containing protein [Pseudoalteromonas sp. GCY]
MKSKHNGFTLIELLLAITILSGLLLVGNYSYQILASRWQDELGQFSQFQEFSRKLTLFNRTLNGIQPYVVKKRDNLNVRFGFLFEGGEQSLLSISKVGLMQQDFPEVFRLVVQKQENEKYSLLYQAKSTKHFLLKYSDQNIEFSKTYVLFKDLDEVRFNYLGWDSINQKSNEKSNGETPTWRRSYSGLDLQQLPEEIAILMKQDGKDLLYTIELDKNTLRYLTPYLDIS